MDGTGGGDDPGALRSSLSTMRGGMILVGLGAVITVGTYLRAAPGDRYFQMWGLMLLGVATMIYGYGLGRRLRSAESRARIARSGVACAVVLVVSSAGWYGAWMYRAPFWSAVEALSRGNEAARKLRTIAERHAARAEAGISGLQAVEAWKEAAAGGIPLRADFAAAADAAGYLREAGGADIRARAEADASFFPLCLEWIDLYETVLRQTGEESMAEPPVEWERRQNDIVDRIQALPPAPTGEGGT